MKQHAIKNTIWTAILIFALCTSAIAQTSASSTPANQSPSASSVAAQVHELKGETTELRVQMAESEIARLLRELRTGRLLTAEQDANLNDAQVRLTAELANSASLEKSYASAVREIDSLRKALDYADVAIKSKDETIKVLTDQRDKARQKAHSANKRSVVLGVVAAALTILRFVH